MFESLTAWSVGYAASCETGVDECTTSWMLKKGSGELEMETVVGELTSIEDGRATDDCRAG